MMIIAIYVSAYFVIGLFVNGIFCGLDATHKNHWLVVAAYPILLILMAGIAVGDWLRCLK